MSGKQNPGNGAGLTKEQRRARAREVAKRMAAEEAARKRRNIIISWIVGIVVVALVGGLVWYIVSEGSKQSASQGSTTSQSASGDPQLTATKRGTDNLANLPQNTDQYGGIPVGSSLKAGTSNEGVPNVTVYYDFMCIYCNQLEHQYADQLTELAKEGKITLTYAPVRIFQDEFSSKAAQAEYWMAENQPDLFLKFHNQMFSEVMWPMFENGEPSTTPENSELTRVAKEVGVKDTSALQKALDDDAYASFLTAQGKQFQADGFTGTPTVLINEQQLSNWPGGVLLTAINQAMAK